METYPRVYLWEFFQEGLISRKHLLHFRLPVHRHCVTSCLGPLLPKRALQDGLYLCSPALWKLGMPVHYSSSTQVVESGALGRLKPSWSSEPAWATIRPCLKNKAKHNQERHKELSFSWGLGNEKKKNRI